MPWCCRRFCGPTSPIGTYVRRAGDRRFRRGRVCRRLLGSSAARRAVGLPEICRADSRRTGHRHLPLYVAAFYTTKLSVPFFKSFNPDLGWFYIVFVLLVIVGSSNAVNLTDGLDGLAIGPVMIAALAYTIVAYVTGNRVMAELLLIPTIRRSRGKSRSSRRDPGIEPRPIWFNTYPASVFMGDVGSLPLGAALGTVAVISKHELLLLGRRGVRHRGTLGNPGRSYKLRGKRIFSMAPIHHHLK
ncbi:MAG: hypothetical protein U0231_09510 [Nitrospiraceae bacterium]